VAKEEEKKERSKGKRVVEREDQGRQINKERWIMDNSANGKIHQRILWSTSRERRKDRLAKP
jgi:hypothetical protein